MSMFLHDSVIIKFCLSSGRYSSYMSVYHDYSSCLRTIMKQVENMQTHVSNMIFCILLLLILINGRHLISTRPALLVPDVVLSTLSCVFADVYKCDTQWRISFR